MKCFKPVRFYRLPDGSITHNENQATNSNYTSHRPCGQCIGCRLNHAEGWAIRMMHEASRHEENSFLTLTYNDDNIPDFESLDYTHVQKFIKKLRRRLEGTKYEGKIKFYRVGEYGDSFQRPHYHIIIFGFDFSSPIPTDRGRNHNIRTFWRGSTEKPYYRSTLLEELWTHGNAEIGDVNYNTAMYVAKYVTKKLTGKNKKYYQERNILPETSSMSKKNPIGKAWIEEFYTDIYPNDFCVHDGKKIKPPKAYDAYLEKHYPKLFQEVKQAREDSMQELDKFRLNVEHEVRTRIHESYNLNPEKSHDWYAINYVKGDRYDQGI